MGSRKKFVARALIFDLDGTLIDSKRDLIHSVNAMLCETGRERLPAETISGYIGHGAPVLVARALGGAASEEEREQALQIFSGLLRRTQDGQHARVSGSDGDAGGIGGARTCRWRC